MGALEEGARNLVVGCGGFRAGQRVLVVCEDPALGWHDAAAPEAVARCLAAIGAEATLLPVAGPEAGMPPAVAAAMDAHDGTIFFARIGDQDRFAARDPGRTVVMSYARTAEALASDFGRLPHGMMVALKEAVEALCDGVRQVRISCPLGTALEGETGALALDDVSIRRFPLCVPRPLSAAGLEGRVALARWLTPTGSRAYAPAWLALEETVFAVIAGGRVQRYEGPARLVAAVEAHYAAVAGRFDIDPGVVHSWHAGIHPGCAYGEPAAEDPDRWSNSLFGSPRFLHFHTCGDYAPGEICWMVQDPTIMLDGVDLWRGGRLVAGALEGQGAFFDTAPGLREALGRRVEAIG